MKRNFLLLIAIAMTGFTSCSKEKTEPEPETIPFSTLFEISEMPGAILSDMIIDNNHEFYFVKYDYHWASNTYRYYLLKKATETGNFEIIDDLFMRGKLCFDKNNHLWFCDNITVYRIEGNSYNKIVELPEREGLPYRGMFQFLAVDNDNNIWAGGLQTDLYKIDNELNITRYDVNNSILPTNMFDAIHIDKNNTVWVGFWGGVLKISDDQWVVYDDFTSQRIWCLATDKNGHLWAGMGWDDENQSLMRFDGTQWETVNPRNEKNEIVKGIVRHLQSDGNKIYVVSERDQKTTLHSFSHELLTFDGVKWDKVHEIPKEDLIGDLVVDNYRKAVYVRTFNKGIFKLPF